jgi:hypothetical protein
VTLTALFVGDGYVQASCIFADVAFMGVTRHAVTLFRCSLFNVVLYCAMYCASCESGGVAGAVVVDFVQPATDRDAIISSAMAATVFFAIRFAFFNVL